MVVGHELTFEVNGIAGLSTVRPPEVGYEGPESPKPTRLSFEVDGV